jgi:hypothetical protein
MLNGIMPSLGRDWTEIIVSRVGVFCSLAAL